MVAIIKKIGTAIPNKTMDRLWRALTGHNVVSRTNKGNKMKRMSSILFVTLLVMFSGCSNPGIVKISQDTYMIYRTDRSGIFGNEARMKANVIQEAHAFAESQGIAAIPISYQSTPMRVGQFATFEYQFRIVDKNDPEAQRTSLVPRSEISVDLKFKDQSEKTKDVYTELIKLDDLRTKGIITEEEYEAQKKKLLSGQ